MKVGVFGSGMVAQTIGGKVAELGHEVKLGTQVVKSLNTVTADLMVNPSALPGDHDVFVSGNDPEAKAKVTEILRDWFGWKSVIDLGDITSARTTEMLMPFWLRMWGVLGGPMFNYRIVR